MWSHPTACTHRETHVTLDGIKLVTMATKTKKAQLNFLWVHPRVHTKDETYKLRKKWSVTLLKIITFLH